MKYKIGDLIKIEAFGEDIGQIMGIERCFYIILTKSGHIIKLSEDEVLRKIEYKELK